MPRYTTAHFRLARQAFAVLQEVVEVECCGVVCRDAHRAVEDDDALQRVAQPEDAVSLVVLLLLAHKEESNLGIVNHKLYLLLRRGGIEWY